MASSPKAHDAKGNPLLVRMYNFEDEYVYHITESQRDRILALEASGDLSDDLCATDQKLFDRIMNMKQLDDWRKSHIWREYVLY